MKKIIHVFHLQTFATGYRYASDFNSFLAALQDKNRQKGKVHEYVCKIKETENYEIELKSNIAASTSQVKLTCFSEYRELVGHLSKERECSIIFHQLADPKLLIYLWMNKKVVASSSWMIWGGDLYSSVNLKISLKNLQIRLFDFLIKRQVVKRLKVILAVPDDYNVAEEHYGKLNQHAIAIYPHRLESMNASSPDGKPIIMVGHSASVVNNHIKIMEHLHSIYNGDFQVFCPLSYGNKAYAASLIKIGEKLFDQDFKYVTTFMNADRYNELLRAVSVAVFDCQRQSSIGNLTRLIAMRKKIFFRRGVSPLNFFSTNGIKLEDLDTFYEADLAQILKVDGMLIQSNYENLIRLYSIDNTFDIWEKVFEVC